MDGIIAIIMAIFILGAVGTFLIGLGGLHEAYYKESDDEDDE